MGKNAPSARSRLAVPQQATQVRAVVAALAVAALAACGPDAYSGERQEPGRVEQATYIPSSTSSGVGFTSGGNVAVVSSTTSAQYVFVFSCPHGKFSIQGRHAQEIFNRLKQGDSVTIVYREAYKRTKEGRLELIDLDFVDATVRPVASSVAVRP